MEDRARFVLSKDVVRKQLESLKPYSDQISYSLKTNYEVGKVLQDISVCMFSVHSVEEAKLVKDTKRIWFFAQAWDADEIQNILDLGIDSFVVDNERDLTALLDIIQKKKIKVNLLLRMRLKEHTIHTGKHFVSGFYSDYVNKVIPKLRRNSCIDSLGIHFHRKTQNVSEWSLKQELEQSLSEEVLQKINIVNIGGGLPGVYLNYTAEMLPSILKKIDELRIWLSRKDIKMILEPGRYIAASSVKLVARIKLIYDSNIVINCSVYNSAMDVFIANIRLLVEGETSPEEGRAYTIKGCTPDSLDIFRYKVYLKNPRVGDIITFLNAGAYNFSCDFCKLPKLETEIEE